MVEHSDPMSLGNTLVSATLEPVTSAENRVELAACIAGSTGAAFWPVIVPQAFSGDPDDSFARGSGKRSQDGLD